MTIRFDLTPRMAELAGFRRTGLQLPEGAALADAIQGLRLELLRGPGSVLVSNGSLLPSVLVVVDGEACPPGANPLLAEGAVIHLLLPVAGG